MFFSLPLLPSLIYSEQKKGKQSSQVQSPNVFTKEIYSFNAIMCGVKLLKNDKTLEARKSLQFKSIRAFNKFICALYKNEKHFL